MPDATRSSGITTRQLPARTAGPLRAWPTDTPGEGQVRGRERRNIPARQALLHRVRSEWEEMPGLRLTLVQARRLFGLEGEVCLRVLQELTAAEILRHASGGLYVLRRSVVA